MAIGLKAFGTAAAVAVMLVSGCASEEKTGGAAQTPDSSGFAWVGQGEPTNFANDHNFCSRTTGIDNTSMSRISSGADAGTNPYMTSRSRSSRGDYATKRQFWQCMQSRGWQLVGAR